MGSQFDDRFAEWGVEALFEHLADSGVVVKYLDPLEDDVTLTVILDDPRIEEIDRRSGGTASVYVRAVTFCVDQDSQYGGVAAPKLGHDLEIDGENWTIIDPVDIGSNLAVVTVTRPVQTEVSREGYRRNT